MGHRMEQYFDQLFSAASDGDYNIVCARSNVHSGKLHCNTQRFGSLYSVSFQRQCPDKNYNAMHVVCLLPKVLPFIVTSTQTTEVEIREND
jgi:hypothetical protein